MSKPTHPYFSFFPVLPLSKTLHLGEWCIGTPDPKVPWRSPRFKELALTHLNAFVKEGFKNGALMWHRERGFDGSMPEPHVWAAIRATICFVALDANDHLFHELNAGHYIATSENAELYTHPIDEEKAYIAHHEGGLLKRVLSAGWKIGEETAALPDAAVAVLQPVIPSQRLATALFTVLLDSSNPINHRIGIALEWHRFALSNPKVVSWSQRLISLKTGFEAISGKSKSHECARFLRNLFEDTTRPYREEKNAAPAVTTDGINTAMSDEDAATSEVMDIETAAPEPADDYLDSDDADEQEAGVDAEPDTKPIAPEPAHLPLVPVRDLSALLAALKCEAANKVRLKKVAAQRAPTNFTRSRLTLYR